MKLKVIPEDFIVDEVINLDFKGSGAYTYFTLTKKNWTTERALQQLAKRLRKNRKVFATSGTKDKEGITTQYVSGYNLPKKDLSWIKIKDIKLTFKGYKDTPLQLNEHSGNQFEIVVRDLKNSLKTISFFCNYYDDQRFGGRRPNTAKIGKLLVQEKFEEAMKVYVCYPFESESKEHIEFRNKIEKNWGTFNAQDIPHYLIERKAIEHLEKNPNDFIGAFKNIPKRILTLFVHAYQSQLFNEILNTYVKENYEYKEIPHNLGKLAMSIEEINIEIPLIGFDFVNDDEALQKIIDIILAKENLDLKQFKSEKIPFISVRTTKRKASIKLEKLEVGLLKKDELHKGKNKQTVSFFLPSGSYATMAVKAMIK